MDTALLLGATTRLRSCCPSDLRGEPSSPRGPSSPGASRGKLPGPLSSGLCIIQGQKKTRRDTPRLQRPLFSNSTTQVSVSWPASTCSPRRQASIFTFLPAPLKEPRLIAAAARCPPPGPGPQAPCRLPRPKRSCGAGALPSRSPAHQLSLEKARRNRMPRAKEDRILLAAARGKWRGRPRRVQSRAAAGFKCPAGPPAPAPQSQARSPRPLAPDRPRGPAQRKPTAHPPAEMPAPGSLLLCPGLGTRSAPQLQGPPQPGAAHSLPAGTESGIPHFSALRDDPIRQSQLFLRRLPVRRSGGPDTDEKLMHAGGLELMLRGPHITPLSTGVPWGAGWGGRGGVVRELGRWFQTYLPAQTEASCSTHTPEHVLSKTRPTTPLTERLASASPPGRSATAIPAVSSGGSEGPVWGRGFSALNSAPQIPRVFPPIIRRYCEIFGYEPKGRREKHSPREQNC